MEAEKGTYVDYCILSKGACFGCNVSLGEGTFLTPILIPLTNSGRTHGSTWPLAAFVKDVWAAVQLTASEIQVLGLVGGAHKIQVRIRTVAGKTTGSNNTRRILVYTSNE